MHAIPTVTLKPGRQRSLVRRHPWIFSGAIDRVDGDPGLGDTVQIREAGGEVLARGAFSPHSQIAVRVWSFEPEEDISPEFFRARLERSVATRARLDDNDTCARLVYSESDGLPGVIVDRYADTLVCQFLSAGAERWKSVIVETLAEILPVSGIFERSDIDVRNKEGLAPATGVLAGAEPPERIEIIEGGLRYLVDVRAGHKTGFYLDQRRNRSIVAHYARDAEVLDCYSYTGAFAVACLAAGARHVTMIDSSAPSLELAAQNVTLNGFEPSSATGEEGDTPRVLRRYRDAGRQFDMVILDPPKFAHSRDHLERAASGYKDINLMAIKLLKPGGVLATFSCSQLVGDERFQRIVSFAAMDAARHVAILHRLHQASDHPVSLRFPESGYLKGLLCHVW